MAYGVGMMKTNIVVDVLSRDGRMHPVLRAWLDRNVGKYRVHVSNNSVPIARNASVKHFLENDVPAGKKFLVQLDNDLRPNPSTINVLTQPGDLLYCGIVGSEGCNGHYGEGDFGAPCCRMSAALLKKMQPPWFEAEISEDGSSLLACECVSFRRKADALGHPAKMVGTVGHSVTAIATFDKDGRAVLAWPPELRRR